MPSRLSKVFSRTKENVNDKEKAAAAEAEKNRNNESSGSNSPPPEYAPPDYDAENALEPPDVTAGFANLSLDSSGKDSQPTVDECIAHLKLLECFYRLRQKIGSSDGLFGIHDSIVLDARPAEDKAPELLAKLAEKRWAIYLARAVSRFHAWLKAVLPDAKKANINQLQVDGERGLLCKPSRENAPLKFLADNLPPVDVLMVWHAYMLNPRDYLEDCLRHGRMNLWHTPMPWATVASCIDSESFVYNPDQVAVNTFEAATGWTWESTADTSKKNISCPSCKSSMHVPWNYIPSDKLDPSSDLGLAVDMLLSVGNGYCDKDFSYTCNSCMIQIDHQKLCAGKFCTDVKELLDRGVPMAGTVLGLDGIPWKHDGQKDALTKLVTEMPNKLLNGGLGTSILSGAKGTNDSMEHIKDVIEAATKSKSYMRKVNGSLSSRLQRAEKIGIRRMMSRYWENSSPYALDLVGAVIRQGTFIEKMHNIDWLHSPALPSTMKRLLVKYGRFVGIMAQPNNMAVPTLDVDLAWHTHQLKPYQYMDFTVKVTKRFIDHDDKVAETKLNDAFAWTSKTYQKQYGEPYSECTCWYCEAIRESHTSAASRIFGSSNATAADQLTHEVDQDPARSVHISTHNAVRPRDADKDATYKYASVKKAAELEKAYEKACERAKKKGKKPPKRDDYYYSDAWGYPVYIPAYSPYVGYVPYCPMYYPVAPGCMAVGAGAVGNCAAGTCGGGVAAGGCGGAGGGCAGGGGGAGGCGGGGGGCGGGGGGGGGCGGGGGG